MGDSQKLYVGNLSYNTTNDGLKVAFESFGEVEEAIVIMDRDSGRSRGFGFVTFAKSDDAVEARKELNGKELDGRTIRVDNASKNR